MTVLAEPVPPGVRPKALTLALTESALQWVSVLMRLSSGCAALCPASLKFDIRDRDTSAQTALERLVHRH
jgi:hypothetical protein